MVYSQAAYERAAATLNNARPREDETIHKPLFHLQAQRFATPEAAQETLTALAKGWTYHQLDSYPLSDHKHYARNGRPTPSMPVKAIDWQIQAHVRPHEAAIGQQKPRHACFVIGTTIGASEWGDTKVIAAYKRQSQVEGGFRFLKDPRFFVSSLVVNRPCCIRGLLMVMTLALLVYSVAQRRLRQQLAHQHQTVPNQLNQPTTSPTLLWVFQRLEGIHRVRVTAHGQVYDLIEGLNDLQIKVLRLFGEEVCSLYHIPPS